MKPTDEERRDIAENLRTMRLDGCRYKEQFYELLDETVMDSWDFHGFYELVERLADLIEPAPERTCLMRYDAVHCDYVCSSCGEFFDMPTYDARDADDALVCRDFGYCPSCGAKVLPAEERGSR